MLTVLGPYATADFEYRGIVRRDGSTAREFIDEGVRFTPFQRREDNSILAALVLDQGDRCGERDKDDSRDPQKLLRGE